jgi:uncharacterized protein YndB with AHSA1/START domain
MKETPAATEPIVVECDLPHPPAQVWRALTERDLLGAWLLPNDLSPEAGARFRFQPEGREASSGMDCEVLEAEPHRILRWRQSEAAPSGSAGHSIDSVVTVELTVKPDGGTHLRLVHDAFTVVSSKAQRRSLVPQACASIIPFKFGGSRRSSPIEDRGSQLEDTGHFRAPLRRAA